MKKFFLVIFILLAVIFSGCGTEKTTEQSQSVTETEKNDKVASILLKNSFWVMDSDNMKYLNDAIARKDAEYLDQLMIERKVFFVDKDTKVTRFGVAADRNNVLIIFNEGRYTNKTGCTHAINVIAEENFPAYVEEQKQKKIALIQESLLSTERYADVVATGNLEEINRLSKVCLDKTNELKRFRQEPESDILEQSEMAIDIIFARDSVLFDYKGFVEYSQNTSMKKHYEGAIQKDSQKAEQLRQEFRNKYGY
ncbi:MAG: hypothetical protein IKI76_11005 [Selenomonadaceae bacterium]|nr:hypothetical protein [Selenomonadaceae bacterium]